MWSPSLFCLPEEQISPCGSLVLPYPSLPLVLFHQGLIDGPYARGSFDSATCGSISKRYTLRRIIPDTKSVTTVTCIVGPLVRYSRKRLTRALTGFRRHRRWSQLIRLSLFDIFMQYISFYIHLHFLQVFRKHGYVIRELPLITA